MISWSVTLRHMLLALVGVVVMTLPAGARAQQFTDTAGITPSPAGMPKELEHVGVKEHLDGQLPLDATFRDHTGKPFRLAEAFDGKRPVLMLFAYHSCAVICSMIANAAARAMQGVPWTVGRDYQLVVISIDPTDTLERATAKRAALIAEYNRGENASFHYLLGDKANIDKVADAAGFAYEYDERQHSYGHPSLLMMVKPNGQMARYLYGLEFDPADVKLGLLEASAGRSVTTLEQIILYCYHYDPQGGKYVLVATRVMQVAGFCTAMVVAAFLIVFWVRERRRGGLLAQLEPEHQRSGPAKPRFPLSTSGGASV